MPTICPHSQYDPLSPTQTEPRMQSHDVICIHTMAGYFTGTDSMFHQSGYGGTESHFGISETGFAKQWQDLDYQADANLYGNPYCISIETADLDPDDFFPNWIKTGEPIPPFTDYQLVKLIEICSWLIKYYNIPPTLIPDTKPGRRGIAYHRQGIDPWRVSGGVKWSDSYGKPCPGDARIHQIETIIVPRLQGMEVDMPLSPEDLTAIDAIHRKYWDQVIVQGETSGPVALRHGLERIMDIRNFTDDIPALKTSLVAAVETSVDTAIDEHLAHLNVEITDDIRAGFKDTVKAGVSEVLGSLDNP